MAIKIQNRRGTADDWTAVSTVVLAAGEIGFETDSGKFKIGDGVKTWSALPYFQNESTLGSNLIGSTYINVSQDPAGPGYTVSFNQTTEDTHNDGRYIKLSGATATASTLTSSTSSSIPLTVKGVASQSVSLQEWQNSSSTSVASVDNSGNITATSLIKTGGTDSQILLANGTTVDKGTYAPLAGPTFTGTVNLATGSGTTAPVKFSSGLMATPTAGVMEYDGTVFYATPMSSGGRGVLRNSYEYIQNTARVATAPSTSVTGIFGTSTTTTGVGLTLPAASYEFEMYFSESMTENTTSHTLGLLFPCTGGTYATINYSAISSTLTASAAAAVITNSTASTFTAITGAATTSAVVQRGIYVRGFFRLSTGGVWTPQMQWSASGVTGNLTINAGSFVRVTPVNTNTATNTSVGDWN
jgi:hypothetical protein